jgi:hypothetical protein
MVAMVVQVAEALVVEPAALAILHQLHHRKETMAAVVRLTHLSTERAVEGELVQ